MHIESLRELISIQHLPAITHESRYGDTYTNCHFVRLHCRCTARRGYYSHQCYVHCLLSYLLIVTRKAHAWRICETRCVIRIIYIFNFSVPHAMRWGLWCLFYSQWNDESREKLFIADTKSHSDDYPWKTNDCQRTALQRLTWSESVLNLKFSLWSSFKESSLIQTERLRFMKMHLMSFLWRMNYHHMMDTPLNANMHNEVLKSIKIPLNTAHRGIEKAQKT